MQVKLHLRKMTFCPQYRMQERMELEEKLMARLRDISDQRKIAAFAQKCGVSQANLSRALGVKAQQLGLDEIFIDVKFAYVYIVFTTNGEGEHTRHTSRKVARKPRSEEAPTSTEHGKPQAHGSGKARDGREGGEVKTRGPSGAGARKGVMWNGVLRKDAR